MENDNFTALEKSILEWIVRRYPDPALKAQIENAKITKREYTGVGWYIFLEVQTSIGSLNSEIESPIGGPNLRSPEIEHGGGSLLFHKNGMISSLELFAYGNRFEKEISTFELYDL